MMFILRERQFILLDPVHKLIFNARQIYILTNYKFINTALINIITIDRIMSFYRERGKNEFVPRDFYRS